MRKSFWFNNADAATILSAIKAMGWRDAQTTQIREDMQTLSRTTTHTAYDAFVSHCIVKLDQHHAAWQLIHSTRV